MPQLSQNSSSLPARAEPDEYKKFPDNSQETDESTEIEINTSSQESDWYYATEALMDALPRPWTRSMLYLILGLTAVVLPWAMVAKIDETGSARGRVEPKGATQELDSQASGSVVAVRVKEGERVKAGQVLLELESEVMKTELQEAYSKLEGSRNQQANLDLLKNQLLLAVSTQEQQNQAQQLAKLSQLEQARQNLNALKTAYNLQKTEKEAKVSQIQQALNSSTAVLNLAKVRLQGAKEKIPRYQTAYKEGVISQDRFLDAQQSEKENYENLMQAQSQMSQAQSSLKEQQSNYQKTIYQAKSDIQQAELRLQEEQRNYQSLIHIGTLAKLKNQEQLKQVETQINTLQAEISQTKSQILSIKIQLGQRVVRSPVTGVIFELPIAKPGVVVQPGEKLAKIAPENAALVLKAQIPSQHSGFIKIGNQVKIKFDAYPFQDYGVVKGTVKWISPDSKEQQTPQGKIETYDLEIVLEHPYILQGNKKIVLTPGQTATAEVVVRQRHVIDLLLDPFKKLQKGGLDL